MMPDNDTLVRDHFRALRTPRITACLELAYADLYEGPPWPEDIVARAEALSLPAPESFAGMDFGDLCKEIEAWADDVLEEVWVDTDAGFVETTNPEFNVQSHGHDPDRDGTEDFEPDLSMYQHYDLGAVRRAVFGALASYL